MSYVVALREALADLRAMNENLRRKRDALRHARPHTRSSDPPRVKPIRTRDYTRAPYIPPWATIDRP